MTPVEFETQDGASVPTTGRAGFKALGTAENRIIEPDVRIGVAAIPPTRVARLVFVLLVGAPFVSRWRYWTRISPLLTRRCRVRE